MFQIGSSLTKASAARIVGMLSAVGMIFATIVVLAPVGAAQAACRTTIGLPAKIAVTRPYQEIKVPLHTSCTTISWADADLYGPSGYDTFLDWDPASNGKLAYLDVYGSAYDVTTAGAYHTRNAIAYDRDYNRLPISDAVTTIKLGSRVGLSATRSNGYANIRFSTWRYYTRYERFQTGGGEQVSVTHLKNGQWAWISSPTSDRTGVGTLRFRTNDPQTFRVCSRERSYVWTSCSIIRK